MIPFTASQIPLAVIKKLGMHSTNAVSNPGHAFPSLVADDLGPSDAIDSDDDLYVHCSSLQCIFLMRIN